MTQTGYHHFSKAPAPGAPLVFAFHGTGGDENQFTDIIGQLLPQAGIIAPRGDVSEHGANRFFRRTGEGVYDMGDLAIRTSRMAGFVRTQAAQHPGSIVIGLGYSNGANILASVLFQAPELFDRAVLMHPLIPFAPTPNPDLKECDLLITAGARDPICPLPLTQALERYFAAQGAHVDLMLHEGGHEIRQEELTRIAAFLKAA